MSEYETELKTIKISYECDKCNKGQMLPTGACLLSDPPQYPHSCNYCGFDYTFRKNYPLIKYVEK